MNHETDQMVERVRLELLTRRFMVMMIGLIAVWSGIAIMLTGAPNFIEEWFSPWSRYAIGSVAFGFGLISVTGGLFDEGRRRGWWIQAVGLGGVTFWYVSMGLIYTFLVSSQGIEIVQPGDPMAPGVTGRVYVPLVYAGLALMSGTPLVVMMRLARKGLL